MQRQKSDAYTALLLISLLALLTAGALLYADFACYGPTPPGNDQGGAAPSILQRGGGKT